VQLPAIELILQLALRGTAVLMCCLALDIISVRGRRLVLCLPVLLGLACFAAYYSSAGGFITMVVGMVSASVACALVTVGCARSPADLVVAGSVVVQSVLWLLMGDRSNLITGGEGGVRSPMVFTILGSGWPAIATIFAVCAAGAAVCEGYWRSRAGRNAALVGEDRLFAVSLGLSTGGAVALTSIVAGALIALAVVAWLSAYQTLQGAAFTLDLALLPALGVMVSRTGRGDRSVYGFVGAYVALAVLVRTYFGSSGPVLERAGLACILIFVSLRDRR
jgi:hypothetical protein